MRRGVTLIAVGASLVAAGSVAAQTSNQFSVVSVQGRTVTADVPGPGALDLHQAPLPPGQGTAVRGYFVIRPTAAQVATAGDVELAVKLNRSGVRQLRRTGHLKRTVELTYTPNDGQPNSIQFVVRLKRGG